MILIIILYYIILYYIMLKAETYAKVMFLNKVFKRLEQN